MTTAAASDEHEVTDAGAIENEDNARAAYAAIATRAQGYNALQWQTPALALTAEAFLLQIALGSSSTPPARLVASALNFILSLMCIQLMTKHREMQIYDRIKLIELETRLRLPKYHSKPRLDLPRWKRILLFSESSTRLWRIGFAGLALVALGTFVVTAVRFLGSA